MQNSIKKRRILYVKEQIKRENHVTVILTEFGGCVKSTSIYTYRLGYFCVSFSFTFVENPNIPD